MAVEKRYIRTSERASYRRCRQQWWWAYVDRLKAIETGPALRFGGLIHAALELWYPPGIKRGVHPAKSFERLYKEDIEAGLRDFNVRLEEDEGWADALELGIGMMKHYVDHYGNDDDIKVIGPEFPMSLDIKHRGRYLVTYLGRFDMVYQERHSGQIGLIESKTATHIGTRHLPLDEQAGSYWAFAPEVLVEKGILKPGQDIDFINYNFMRKALPDERPRNEAGLALNKPTKQRLLEEVQRRKIPISGKATIEQLAQALGAKGINPAQFGEVSKNQPPPYFLRTKVYRDDADRANLISRVKMEAWEMEQVRRGRLPVYKSPAFQWPDQHCNACQFSEMCALHETGADWTAIRDATMTTHDPYADDLDPYVEEP